MLKRKSSFCTGARRQKVLLIKRSETFAQNNKTAVDLSFSDKNDRFFFGLAAGTFSRLLNQ
ncbi:hypothetical protein ACNKHP_03040 [Shigella boydii]